MLGKTQYWSLQGRLFLADRTVDGNCGALAWMFNVPKFELTLKTQEETKIESFSGLRTQDDSFNKSVSLDIAVEFDGFNPNILAAALYGTPAPVTSSTVTNEVLPTGLENGDFVRLNHENVSSVVLHDSTGSPLTLAPGTNYDVESDFSGLVQILDVGAYVQPFKASYSYGDSTVLAMFTQQGKERWAVFDGINTRDGSLVKGDIYRMKLAPAASMPLINDGYGSISMTGTCLYDVTKSVDPLFGGLGRFVFPSS